ncbi:predicted protein [Lichtheimia corymbifera JMRC:FSU:9682]|uniref:Uncharacterized protein n=1 Tax=Lichtheimia corymbifera JMRC:FSU:9682 TaxID=1263082 RepID=A0A068RJ30_9FUNG|nr:predicted protein [Lichtheimia corymbifera JMRC:FSU:9682]
MDPLDFAKSDSEDEPHLTRYHKTYHIQVPGKNLQSPHRPKLQEVDSYMLDKYVAIRVSIKLMSLPRPVISSRCKRDDQMNH